jgi:hypothetical protein
MITAQQAREKALSIHAARDIEGSLEKRINEAAEAGKTYIAVNDKFFWKERDLTEEILTINGFRFEWDLEDELLHIYWNTTKN